MKNKKIDSRTHLSFVIMIKVFILMSTWMIGKSLMKHQNFTDITDADYMHAKGVCKDFGIKKFR